VIGQIRSGEGGVIIIPASLVVTAVRRENGDRTGLLLAERAVSWANRSLTDQVAAAL